MSDVEEAAELEAALEWCLEAISENVATFRTTHSEAETVLGIRADFQNLAWVRLAFGSSQVLADYVGFGMALLRLLDARQRIRELEDAVAFRDSVIVSLGDLEDL